jgi:uncharacterized protein YbjQ (UPF0145 family)
MMNVFATTTMHFEGYEIKVYKGIVRGITVRAPTISQGILGSLNSIVGGQIQAYTEMCEQARWHAYNAMLKNASDMGANGVLGVRFDASEVANGATEVLCYGTAVILEQKMED